MQLNESGAFWQLVGKRTSTMTSKLSKLFKPSKRADKMSDGGEEAEGANMTIGEPFNVVRNYHVNFDREKGCFVGLPPSWTDLLKSSNIT